MSLPTSKKGKENANREVSDVAKEAKSFIDKILGDVSKTSATKQIIIGTTSGWATGFLTMKVGKIAAFAVGGGIIMLQIAANQGYININWDKIQKKADKISDKVEEKLTGEGPKLVDKMERFVDRKMDKAEQLLKSGETRGRRWYQNIIGSDTMRSKPSLADSKQQVVAPVNQDVDLVAQLCDLFEDAKRNFYEFRAYCREQVRDYV